MISTWFKQIHLVLCVRLNAQIELITPIKLIGDDFLLCSQHHGRKARAYNITFPNIQTIYCLSESIAGRYKSRESREQ